jgi:ornithine cyclodeaminase
VIFIDAAQVHSTITMLSLINRLKTAFRAGCVIPQRQIEHLPADEGSACLISMPAVACEGEVAVKLVTYFPENPKRGLPTVQGVIVVFSTLGTPIACIDAHSVTLMRTGAASALASTYLSRPQSSRLLIIGTGALAPYLALAHSSVRPIEHIGIWGRDYSKAQIAARKMRELGCNALIECVESLPDSVSFADIISCATASPLPVLQGAWLSPGVFVDLVGSFSPTMREADDDVVRDARIFVDTFDGALCEAGDVIDPLARGVIQHSQIEADLFQLTRKQAHGRSTEEEKIVFKSVGTALEDLATVQLLSELALPPLRLRDPELRSAAPTS